MSRYNTGNPLDSNSAKDLDDNAKNADLFLNSEDLSWNDRLNKQRKTIAGIESDGNDAVNGIIQDGADAIAGLGYVPLDDGIWTAGKTFTSYNQYLVYSEATYKVKASTSLPYGPIGAAPDLNDVEAFDGSLLFAEKCRFSKLDNPLVRVFNKNKVVESLNGSLSFTRDSTATYIDRHGNRKTAVFDELRQQSDGWLIESASTNSLTHSKTPDVANPGWQYFGEGNVVLTPNTTETASPDGTLTASKMDKSVADTSRVGGTAAVSSTLGDGYTSSMCVKAGTATAARISWVNFSGGVAKITTAEFDLVAEVFTLLPSSGYVTSEKLNNGWFNLSITNTIDDISNTSIRNDFEVCSGQVGTMYFADCQIEKLPYTTSYIETTDSPVTRLADTVTIPAMVNIPPINHFSVAFELSDINYSIDFPDLFKIDYQNVSAMLVGIAAGGKYYAEVRNQDGTLNYATSDILHALGESRFFVVTITDDFIKLYIDGELAAQTAVTGPIKEILDLNDVDFKFTSNSNRGSAQYNDLRIYDFELNKAEVKFLSGGK